MACPHHVGMTSEELAQAAYLTLIDLDEHFTETKHSAGIHLLGDLWQRLMPEHCAVEGCGKARTNSFPWCVDHLSSELHRPQP